MKSFRRHPFRVLRRLIWLIAESGFAAATWLPWRIFGTFRHSDTRADWLHYHSRRTLRVFCAKLEVGGPVPREGMMVSNHLGYLDILAIAAVTPCVFVAKSDVRHWPLFGWFAAMAGTIFADRSRRLQSGRAASEIDTALRKGRLVVLFPEGTSSGGATVLPFKASLLEPAVQQNCALTAAFLSYELPGGDVSEEVCYWKDMTLVPHLINLLGKEAVCARVRFSKLRRPGSNRKELAQRLHSEVLNLKNYEQAEAAA